MNTPAQLLARLDAIGVALAASGHGLALVGVGSVGAERERLDAYSDLDFFALVEPGQKAAYLADMGWLTAVHPVAYQFMNTIDGCKLLFADGIFCEFAVFEPQELAQIPFAGTRIVWRRADFDPAIVPSQSMTPAAELRTTEWLLGEALTNLYVGLCRYRRGEWLSAARFIQGHAVDRVIDLAALVEPTMPALRDPFAPERRVEARHPGLAAELPALMLGYVGCVDSARAILAWLTARFAINPAMAARIRALCDEPAAAI